MSGESSSNPNEQSNPEAEKWQSLTGHDVIEQNLQDDLLNIEDMLNSGRINEKQAAEYRSEVNARAKQAKSEEDELQKMLEKMEQRSDDDEFTGERNINAATGKERSRRLFDLYPQEKGESHDHYVQRLHRMKELTEQAEKEAIATDELEKIAADETEKEAALAAEHEITSLEDQETLSVEEAERRKSEHEAAVQQVEELFSNGENLSSEEAKQRIAEHEAAIAKAEENEFDIAALVDKIDQKAEAARAERLEALEAELDDLRPDLAELYAKNRRLIVGSKNRAEFSNAKEKYGKIMDEYLRLKAESTYESGKNQNLKDLQAKFDSLKAEIENQLTDFAGGDLENTEKSPEEIESERSRLTKIAAEALKDEYQRMNKDLECKVNTEFLEDFIAEEQALEEATIDRLDNGTFCRKVVSKVLANKYLKGALIGAGVAGLAITGVGLAAGLAAGTMTVGLGGFTAGGIAAGAARGGLAGAIMSRQSSANSAVRGFADETNLRQQLEGINVLNQDADTQNVANFLLAQYESAKDADLSSNRKRSAIAAGLGAAIGGFMSGVQINHTANQLRIETEQVGTNPTEYQYEAANIGNINIPEGHGMSTAFTQMGGDISNYDQAAEIAHAIDVKYGLAPGSNGEVAGFNGLVGDFAHTYPGTIDTWPDTAQAYITEVSNAWAEAGLIPANQTAIGGGEAIYGPVLRTVQAFVPDAFMNFLTQATTTVGVGATAGAIGGMQNRAATVETPAPNATLEAPTESPEPVATLRTPPEAPNNPPTASEPEQQPTTRQSGENEPQSFYELVKSRLGDRLTEEGIGLITMPRESNEDVADNDSRRIEAWWGTLSDDDKNAVIQFVDENTDDSSTAGSAFRFWLSQNPEQNPNNQP